MEERAPELAQDFAARFLAARAQLIQQQQARLMFQHQGAPKPLIPPPLLLLQQQLAAAHNENRSSPIQNLAGNHFSQLLQMAHLQSYLAALAAAANVQKKSESTESK